LGSVIALTNASGTTAVLYEYSVYGQVAASDPNHPNRFMFTGRELDKETGLYYYRARYYNPEIGRFLQTDPSGYGAGMNWYAYCGNNSTNCVDPSGLYAKFLDCGPDEVWLRFAWINDTTGSVDKVWYFKDMAEWMDWAEQDWTFGGYDQSALWDRPGYKLSGYDEKNPDTIAFFWSIQACIYLTKGLIRDYDFGAEVWAVEHQPYRPDVGWVPEDERGAGYMSGDSWGRVHWNPGTGFSQLYAIPTDSPPSWWKAPDLATLMHEIGHAYGDATSSTYSSWSNEEKERFAMYDENVGRYAYYRKMPGCGKGQGNQIWARTAYGMYADDQSVFHADVPWESWNWNAGTSGLPLP